MNLELYRPAVHDLWFKRDLLADEATMSYNRAWGGTVDFPEDLWGRWHDAWVAREGEGRRFYRYLRDLDAGEFVGEVAYRWDPDYDSFITDVLVHARFRGRGYGAAGLELLCDAARGRGVATCATTSPWTTRLSVSSCVTASSRSGAAMSSSC